MLRAPGSISQAVFTVSSMLYGDQHHIGGTNAMSRILRANGISIAASIGGALLGLLILWPGAAAAATPTSVTIAGSLQSALGCPGDWDPTCVTTDLTYDASDDVWQGSFGSIPAGNWEYKAALDHSWNVNYGLHAIEGGANIPLNLASPTSVKFYYDDKTHWVTDNHNSVIATVPGSFQSALGCPGDWDPGCLRSWLEDPSGSGTYDFATSALPTGNYECKVAINESWDENYGAGGAQNGANIPFTVPVTGATVHFSYNPNTHILTVTVEGVPTPTATPTPTPTPTPLALGDACISDTQCASTFCAPDAVCCNVPCTQAGHSCALPGSVGLCRAQTDLAPAASWPGLLALGVVLAVLGVISLRWRLTACR